MLPGVKIQFSNGNLGTTANSDRNLLGFIISAAAVSTTFLLGTPYLIKKPEDLTPLGVTSVNNPAVEKTVREFYNEAAEGTPMWIYGVADTVKPSEMLDPSGSIIKNFINKTEGALRGILTVFNPDNTYTPTITDGLDADVALAITNGQLAAKWAVDTKFAPFFIIVEGYAFNGMPSALASLLTRSDNYVAVAIGDTVSASKNAAMGVIGGRIASTRPSVKISRVASGPLSAPAIYVGTDSIESVDVETIHDKGYITFRKHVGRSGNYITHDPLATLPTDDYAKLTHRRVINEAYRECYQAGLEFVEESIPVNDNGTIQATNAAYIEKRIEQHIVNTLGASGEISSTPEDSGVVVTVDKEANIVSLSQLPIRVGVRPFGYASYVEFDLGFELTT